MKTSSHHSKKEMKIFANQEHQFETKEIFRKLSRKSHIKVVGIPNGSTDPLQKIQRVKERVENEGYLDVAFVYNGTHGDELWSKNLSDMLASVYGVIRCISNSRSKHKAA